MGGGNSIRTELSKERLGEIAMIAFLQKKEEDGILLKPKEVRRGLINEAKRHDISPVEAALFAKVILEKVYAKAMKEIDSIITSRE